jgi:hypothetical protein
LPYSRLFVFMVTSVLALVVLIIPWYFLSPYLAAPVISVAGQLMDSTFLWVDGFERQETVGTLLTTLNVAVNQNGRLVVGQLSPEVNYRTFGYGLVLFWALLIASRPKGMWLKMALGTLILVPSQVFSMCFRWLREALLINGAEVVRQAGVHRWMLEIIAYFDQFGFLIITPLMPILLWLILDRAFINQLWMEMVMAGAAEAEGNKKSAGSQFAK